jgi:nucleoside-diphosphate-sugar epimerase
VTANAVLVTGGSGFVGAATTRALIADAAVSRLRLLIHDNVPPEPAGKRVEHIRGDLADARSLGNLCEGIDTVVHLATHISDDAEKCNAVNATGTEALVATANSAGVKRLIYVSSAAVYGYAVHSGASEDQATVAPATPISRSRARAEEAVINSGGIVLRPLFVYGNGDTKFIPLLMRALSRLPFLVDRGKARLSVVPVDDLATTLTTLVHTEWDAANAGPYHITDGSPITFRDLATALANTLGMTVPRRSIPYPLARLVLRLAGTRALGSRRWSESAAHRLFLVTHDHFYNDSRLSTLIGSHSSSRFESRIGDYSDWYRSFLPSSRKAVAA